MSSEEVPRFQLRVDDVVWREVDEEVIVLEAESGNYLNLNGSARLLWLALCEAVSVASLAVTLVDAFGIPTEQATADAETFVADLLQRSLVDQIE